MVLAIHQIGRTRCCDYGREKQRKRQYSTWIHPSPATSRPNQRSDHPHPHSFTYIPLFLKVKKKTIKRKSCRPRLQLFWMDISACNLCYKLCFYSLHLYICLVFLCLPLFFSLNLLYS
ncbi:hypothetical protein BDZ91DRAFT_749912 [Kalaharituber pfeilii]|nr:hypothetical protein BDZ91DRAFT_749912 [Kalaharituber pfeilii]